MEQVRSILNKLKIKNRLKHYKTRSTLTVYDVKRYAKLIGFDHKPKSIKLKYILSRIKND